MSYQPGILEEAPTAARDGIVDALFQFTRPITGSYFWCPPIADGKLDLQLLD